MPVPFGHLKSLVFDEAFVVTDAAAARERGIKGIPRFEGERFDPAVPNRNVVVASFHSPTWGQLGDIPLKIKRFCERRRRHADNSAHNNERKTRHSSHPILLLN
jgi:hypothetical protein